MPKHTITIDTDDLDRRETEAKTQIEHWQNVLANVRRSREFLAQNGASTATLEVKKGPEKFAQAMLRIVGESPVPMPKSAVKIRLKESGHIKQDTPQFYTTLKRLKDKGELFVLGNGYVTRKLL